MGNMHQEIAQPTSAFSGPSMVATDPRVQPGNSVYLAVSAQGHVRYVTIDGNLDKHLTPSRLMVIPIGEEHWWEQALRTLVASVLAMDEVRNIFDPETLCVNVVQYGNNHVEKSVWLKPMFKLNGDINDNLHTEENFLDVIPSMDYYRRAAGLLTVTYQDVLHKIKELFDSPDVHERRQSDEHTYFWMLHYSGTIAADVQEQVLTDLRSKGWNAAFGANATDGYDLVIAMPKQI